MPNQVQPRPPVRLDPVDRAIVRALVVDGRLPNNALAAKVGVAPSTALARVRSLRERGVIHGFHADVDLAALDRPLQAMVAVRLRAHTREHIQSFMRQAPQLPGVVTVFHVAGADDYLLQVAVASTEALRDFVLDHLTSHPAVGHTETSLIFGVHRGRAAFD